MTGAGPPGPSCAGSGVSVLVLRTVDTPPAPAPIAKAAVPALGAFPPPRVRYINPGPALLRCGDGRRGGTSPAGWVPGSRAGLCRSWQVTAPVASRPCLSFSPAGLRRWLSSPAPAPRVCVVGSGPAGFYTAQHILKVRGGDLAAGEGRDQGRHLCATWLQQVLGSCSCSSQVGVVGGLLGAA